MLAKKISIRGAIIFVALALVVVGCTPAGPRALLKGKKALDHGDYAAAVAQLKTATTLLQTNAQAWNYYGVALQLAGHPDEATTAYQTALKFDRDLVETHFNLGSLALEQGRADVAKSEFSAYTLRRQSDSIGWLKLGNAQLKLGEVATAERSFSTVLSLKQNEAEAYNGLGLARIQRNLPRDAVKFFAAAIAARADYAPAVLNLATVNQQYLRDNKAALENYKKYAALAPQSANLTEVNALIATLEPAEVKVAANPLPPPDKTPTWANPPEVKPTPKIIIGTTQRVAVVTKPAPTKTNAVTLPPIKPIPVQMVQVKPEPVIVAKPVIATNVPVAMVKPVEAAPVEAPLAEEPPKKSFWGKVFNNSPRPPSASEAKYRGNALTPLPAADAPAATKPAIVQPAKPLVVVEPTPVFARYTYFNPRKPVSGDRTAANGAFTKARLLEQDEKWPDALQWYQQSAGLDPAWFEAQYNTGVLAHRLRNYTLALPRYEMALAVSPDSADARYNFALALKAASYIPDAAEQLKIILAANDKEVRAHLALANICAQSLRDPAQARTHYQKVLALEPNNTQASDIRFWLSGNP